MRQFTDETIVLDTQTSTYLSINATARVIWDQLEHGARASEIAAALEAEFEVSSSQALTDAKAFVELCRNRGFLVDNGANDGQPVGS